MTDRRDDDEDLRELLAELESTLVELREEVSDERRDPPRIPRGLPGAGRRPPRPPRFREVLRFTEEYTIPTLVSILEANIRLLRLAGAAIRGLDPERSTVRDAGDGAVGRALDAGRGLSTDRLASGLAELNEALAGTDAPDPEARELLSEAETLSTEIQERLRDASRQAGASGDAGGSDFEDEAVHIDVTRNDDDAEESTDTPEPDVDAELDSIREEVRGEADDEGVETEDSEDSDDGDGNDDSEDADGTPLE